MSLLWRRCLGIVSHTQLQIPNGFLVMRSPSPLGELGNTVCVVRAGCARLVVSKSKALKSCEQEGRWTRGIARPSGKGLLRQALLLFG